MFALSSLIITGKCINEYLHVEHCWIEQSEGTQYIIIMCMTSFYIHWSMMNSNAEKTLTINAGLVG